MRFCEIQVVGLTLVLGLMICPRINGDEATGQEDFIRIGGKLCFTDGPVRHRPAEWRGLSYIGSDDGYLYCFKNDGKQVWKFRGGPSNRKVLGAGRLMSAWNVSGGPVVHGDRVYFAAGMWPVMGVFVYALDARSGQVIWKNDSANSIWQSETVTEGKGRPEFEPSFISISPNGQCRVEEGKLIVPCGRSRPAYFDVESGQLLTFNQGGLRPWVEKRMGELQYPDFDKVAERKQGCFPKNDSAEAVLRATEVREGYCVVIGIGDGLLIKGLIAHSKMRLLVFDKDEGRVSALRDELVEKEVYGTRCSVHRLEVAATGLPPYIASLIVINDGAANRLNRGLYETLRPYGGILCLPESQAHLAKSPPIEGTETARNGRFVLVHRKGALPGVDDWSHEHANASNTRFSRDDRVRSPFGVLWFGGPSSRPGFYYENHRLHAMPQVAGGRMFIEGPKLISCFDVYTGRMLWEWRPPETDQELWDLDSYVANRQFVQSAFEPMAGRFVSTADAVHIISDRTLYALDAATGKELQGFTFDEKDDWGSPKVEGDTLYLPSANRVVALDRRRGTVRWQHADSGGTLAIGDGKVFCLGYPNPDWPDRFENHHTGPESRHLKRIAEVMDLAKLKRRGMEDKVSTANLVALDMDSGKPAWKQKSILGTRLVYTESRRMVIAVPHHGMARGYSVGDGTETWKALANQNTVFGNDMVIRSGIKSFVLHPLDRKARWKVAHPLQNRVVPLQKPYLQLTKTGNGCGPAIASRHLMTFRSGTGAYFDFSEDPGLRSGVVNLGGFRSSCHPSLIPANGLLVAPNAVAGGCRCRYPLSMSAAFIHMPEMEKWGSYGGLPEDQPITRIGINFGAPGDRMSRSGTLWLDYPSVGGPSPTVEVVTEPAHPEWFRYHASRVIRGQGIRWVQASGAKRLTSITIKLNRDETAEYQVRIYYASSNEDASLSLRASVEERTISSTNELKVTFAEDRFVCGIEAFDKSLAPKVTPMSEMNMRPWPDGSSE